MKNRLLIPVPPTTGSIGTIGDAEALEIIAFKGTAKLVFKAKIAEKVKIGTSLYFIFTILDLGKRIQSRSFFRADVMMDVEFVVLKRAKPVETEEEKPKEEVKTGTTTSIKIGTSRDISGGGMKLVSEEMIEEGDYLTIFVWLNKEKLLITGKIMRREEMPMNKKLYSIQFFGLSDKEQDTIIRFVLELQRRLNARVK
jgi:c-di-GMP-binding flagellar brake protein YcgR